MIYMNGTQLNLVQQGVGSVHRAFNEVVQTLRQSVGDLGTLPAPLQEFWGHYQSLVDAVAKASSGQEPYSFPVEQAAMLRTVIQRLRREKAKELEGFRTNASDAEVIAAIGAKLAPFKELTNGHWFVQATPLRIPQLADFVTLEHLTAITGGAVAPTPIKFEDKFRILYAESGLLAELGRLRDECGRRDLPIAVVFLDLDHFKPLNTRYGEILVDANLLPVFMRLVERTVFGHGQAYRHGGDEIVLLLPNCKPDLAIALLEQLKSSLASAPYAGIEERPTISCGVCVVDSDSPLTDRETLDRAAWAKKFAKEKGRNAIASYSTPLCRDEDLVVLTSAPASAARPAAKRPRGGS